MNLDIPLSLEAERRLRERAAATGEDVRLWLTRVVEEALDRLSLDEMLAPLRRRFSESGISEDELAQDLEREKHALRRENRAPPH